MTRKMRATALLVALMGLGSVVAAQEVASIDLTGLRPRIDLRYPPSPPAKCNQEGVCVSGGYGGMSVACWGSVPGELRIDLTYLDRSEYGDGDVTEIEATIENAGRVPLQIPSSPHLADLQPSDESAEFNVQELQLGAFLELG